MRFFTNNRLVRIEANGQELTIPLERFLELEPDFEYDPAATWEQWIPTLHYKVVGDQQQAANLPSREGYCLKIAEYQQAVATQPPTPEPEPEPGPDWVGFRLALLLTESFRTWSEGLPATWREDLKLSAIAANAEALQQVYNVCERLSEPQPSAVAEWQQLAEENRIPVIFNG